MHQLVGVDEVLHVEAFASDEWRIDQGRLLVGQKDVAVQAGA